MSEMIKWPLMIGALAVIALFLYMMFTSPDRRSGTEKLGDAIHELPQGIDKAGRQLEDRTPGQKLGDKVKDAGDKIKENTNP